MFTDVGRIIVHLLAAKVASTHTETSVTIYQLTWHNISEEMNLSIMFRCGYEMFKLWKLS